MQIPNKKGFKLWFGLIIIGPALLLLYFLWQGWDSKGEAPAPTYELPTTMLSSGSVFTNQTGAYQFFPFILTDDFATNQGNNLAGAGYTYLWLPALVPEAETELDSFYLLDDQGRRSDPFRSYQESEFSLEQALPEISPNSGQKLIYVLFKVPKSASAFYLVGSNNGIESALPLAVSP